MNFLLNPGAGFDGERVLKGLDFAALLYRIGGSGRLRGLRYLLRLRLVRHLRRLRHLHRLRRLRRLRCFRCLCRSRHLHQLRCLRRSRCLRCLRHSRHPGKNRRLKTEATVPDWWHSRLFLFLFFRGHGSADAQNDSFGRTVGRYGNRFGDAADTVGIVMNLDGARLAGHYRFAGPGRNGATAGRTHVGENQRLGAVVGEHEFAVSVGALFNGAVIVDGLFKLDAGSFHLFGLNRLFGRFGCIHNVGAQQSGYQHHSANNLFHFVSFLSWIPTGTGRTPLFLLFPAGFYFLPGRSFVLESHSCWLGRSCSVWPHCRLLSCGIAARSALLPVEPSRCRLNRVIAG